MKVHGLQLIDFIDLLDKHGYGSIASIRKFVVNPLEWPPQQWHFALELIQLCTGATEAEIKKLKPAELLTTFNESMRKTGLIIQLTQTRLISEKTALKHMDVVFQSE